MAPKLTQGKNCTEMGISAIIRAMPKQHLSQFLARIVLAWFMLFIGASVASPWVKPVDLQLVCSAAGEAKLVSLDDDGQASAHANHLLDCPACMPSALPGPDTSLSAPAMLPTPFVLTPLEEARIAAITAAPLPARGPPPSL